MDSKSKPELGKMDADSSDEEQESEEDEKERIQMTKQEK